MKVSPLAQKLQTQRQAILKIAQTYGAPNLSVFGSVARGDDDDASDLDLLVDLAPDRSLFSEKLHDILEAIERIERYVVFGRDKGSRPRWRDREIRELPAS